MLRLQIVVENSLILIQAQFVVKSQINQLKPNMKRHFHLQNQQFKEYELYRLLMSVSLL